jgi:pyrroline-5-carboxylate reductase
MTKIAFLGAGNLATSMVEGLLAKGTFSNLDLICLGGTGKSARKLAGKTGIELARSLEELLAAADVLIVAFKPKHLSSADPRLAELARDRLVISVLTGKRFEDLAQVFRHARNLVRFLPNLPSAIGAGITGWCSQEPLNVPDLTIVGALLDAMGQAVEVKEDDMDAIAALGGAGPAFFCEFVSAMRDAGVAVGLPRKIAATFASQMALGTVRLLVHEQIEPEALRDRVTSPNGTTMAGLQRMEAGNFRRLIQETIFATKSRAEELSNDL